MFTKPTVFILGAGASCHYGYPTGNDLVRQVGQRARKFAQNIDNFYNKATSEYIILGQNIVSSHAPEYILDKLNMGDASALQTVKDECEHIERNKTS